MNVEPSSFSLKTDRLIIRPFTLSDLDAVHRILNSATGEQSLTERRQWLDWTVRSYTALERLYQPPYGDRAIVLKATNEVIGAAGLVPSYGPFDKLPYFRGRSAEPPSLLCTPAIGLFWALGDSYRGQGYATEAAQALIGHAFTRLELKQIIATTEYDNATSIAVMRRLGMTIERNPDATPAWFQVVGILDNPAPHSG